MSRSLDQNEANALQVVLAAVGDPALLTQAQSVTVTGGTATFLDLDVDTLSPAANLPNGPLGRTADALTPDGDPAGVILVWVEDGRLSGLEYGWYTDDSPAGFPAPDRVTVATPS